jgi:hypothetical protein
MEKKAWVSRRWLSSKKRTKSKEKKENGIIIIIIIIIIIWFPVVSYSLGPKGFSFISFSLLSGVP